MITFKTIGTEDEPFSEQVFRSTREQELNLTNWSEAQKEGFIKMQSLAQMADYKKNYKDATYQIIIYKKKPVGRLFLWETKLEIRIIDIALLPDFQRKGIGKKILTGIIEAAKHKNILVSLHVLQNNPAKKLYESLGFKTISTTNFRDYMECRP